MADETFKEPADEQKDRFPTLPINVERNEKLPDEARDLLRKPGPKQPVPQQPAEKQPAPHQPVPQQDDPTFAHERDHQTDDTRAGSPDADSTAPPVESGQRTGSIAQEGLSRSEQYQMGSQAVNDHRASTPRSEDEQVVDERWNDDVLGTPSEDAREGADQDALARQYDEDERGAPTPQDTSDQLDNQFQPTDDDLNVGGEMVGDPYGTGGNMADDFVDTGSNLLEGGADGGGEVSDSADTSSDWFSE